MKDLKEKKSTLENYSGLTKKSTDDDVTFINQVPLHLRERKIRLKNLDQKVDIVNEIVSAKPKPVKQKETLIK